MRKVGLCMLLALGSSLAAGRAPAQATAPAPPAPAPAESAAGAAEPADVGLEFWRVLGDSTLDRLIDEMLRANLDVRAGQARLLAARAARREARLDLAPTGTFAGGYTRQRLSPYAFPNGSGTFPDQDLWDVGFDAAWEIDVFGRLRRALDARQALVEASAANLRDVEVSLAAELARSYFDLRGAQEQITVARRNTENQKRTLDLTRERLDAGRGTAFDTERASAQLSFTLASMPTLETRVAAARYRIGVLLGRAADALPAELDTPGGLPAPPADLAVADPRGTSERRPDVVAAERQLAAQRAFLGAAAAEARPRVTFGGSAGYTATTLDGWGERGTFRYLLGTTISWPTIGFGRVGAGVAAARAREQEALAGYTQAQLRAQEEIATALARYRAAHDRVVQVRDAAASSARAADLARMRFSDGLGDLLDVLDAERTQLAAEDLLAQARTEAATAYAAVYKALGGVWPPAESASGR